MTYCRGCYRALGKKHAPTCPIKPGSIVAVRDTNNPSGLTPSTAKREATDSGPLR